MGRSTETRLRSSGVVFEFDRFLVGDKVLAHRSFKRLQRETAECQRPYDKSMKLVRCRRISEMGLPIERPLVRRVLAAARGFISRIRRERCSAGISAACLVCACLFADASLAAGSLERQSAAGTAPLDTTTESISFRNGLLSVDVKKGSWATTLAKIKEQTGILFHCVAPLEGAVTASFEDLPVKTALEQLFGPEAGFVYRYTNAAEAEVPTGSPAEVWVLGKVRSSSTDDSPSDAEQSLRQAASMAGDLDTKAGSEVRINDLSTRQLMEMANSGNPAQRLEALSSLAEEGRGDQDISRSAFDAALTDKDPNIRGLAVQTLANRSGDEAANYLWQGLRDPEPSVRVMAVQTAKPDGHGLALLQEALSDPDESVRSIAAFRLAHTAAERVVDQPD